MDRIRIGNDIVYEWVILRHDKYIEDFTSAKIIELKISNDSTGETYLPYYNIINNVITVYFPASVQDKCGLYSLHINYTKKTSSLNATEAEYTVDYEGVFELVAQTSEETEPSPEDGKVTSYIYRNRDGADGVSPEIGDNGNWFIGVKDTGKPSTGKPFTYDMFTEEQLEELGRPNIEAIEKAADQKITQHNTSVTAHDDIRNVVKTSIGLPEYDELTHTMTFKTNDNDTKSIVLPAGGEGGDGLYTSIADDDDNLLLDINNTNKTIKISLTDGFVAAFNNKVNKDGSKVLSSNDYTAVEKEMLSSIVKPISFEWTGSFYESSVIPELFNPNTFKIIASTFVQTNPIDNPTIKIGSNIYALKLNNGNIIKERIPAKGVCMLCFSNSNATIIGLDPGSATIEETLLGVDKNKYITPETFKQVIQNAIQTTWEGNY